ncbi:hypothetical protein [Flavobacterium sp.]|uniref:hypothetical protein n=1 Tax=Flavobacterium sp. TaxID=239 RepID=UPI0026229818|nr:hypothetical protein [Flavobacterium sp.]
MKKNIVKIFSFFVVASLFTSCNDDQDVTPIVQIAKPTMTIEINGASSGVITAAEGTTVPFTLTLSQPVSEDFDFFILREVSSTASGEDSDVENNTPNVIFQKKVTIPAFSTTYSDVIVINEDELAEGDENLVLTFGESRTSAVLFTPVTRTIKITNVVSDVLDLTFNFDREFTAGANTYSLCELTSDLSGDPYDVDFLVYDDSFNDLGVADAQTGACPEKIAMDLADYPDGTYHITAFLYTNAQLDLAEIGFPLISVPEFNIPITVDYLRAGSINKGRYTQESSNFFTSNSAEGTENQVVDIVISTVDGKRIFTIQDTAGNVSASGRMASKSKHISKRVK